MKFNKHVSQSQRAFSQFEAIIVLTVMGILGAIAIPIFSNLTESSKLSVLKSNLHHMNAILREAHRAGNMATNVDDLEDGEAVTVATICNRLTAGAGVFIDTDGDGELDPHEIGFEMDVPPKQDPYEYLVGQHLIDDFSVKTEGSSPLQLAIYKADTLYELP